MKYDIASKIYSGFEAFSGELETWKKNHETVVFTNGCFDILHQGHVDSLQKSAEMGDRLIVGLNSDQSVRILKGEGRPVLPEQARALLLAALVFVDAVILFDEETPANLIARIIPDVLVKGQQYEIHEIAGHDTVLNNGGRVETLSLVPGISTTDLINKIKMLK